MATLRHIAIAVTDPQRTARFYESAFSMWRTRESAVAVMLTDGTISLALLDVNKNKNAGEVKPGLHHIGFLVDDLDQAQADIEAAGGKYFGQIKEVGGGAGTERKFTDCDGVQLD